MFKKEEKDRNRDTERELLSLILFPNVRTFQCLARTGPEAGARNSIHISYIVDENPVTRASTPAAQSPHQQAAGVRSQTQSLGPGTQPLDHGLNVHSPFRSYL